MLCNSWDQIPGWYSLLIIFFPWSNFFPTSDYFFSIISKNHTSFVGFMLSITWYSLSYRGHVPHPSIICTCVWMQNDGKGRLERFWCIVKSLINEKCYTKYCYALTHAIEFLFIFGKPENVNNYVTIGLLILFLRRWIFTGFYFMKNENFYILS